MHSHVYCSIIYNSKDMETTQIPINRGMDKEDVICVHIYIYTHTRIYNGILFIHEKGEYHAICKNMDGPWAYYAKWNKSDRERKVLYDITYMWNLKNPKPIKNWE